MRALKSLVIIAFFALAACSLFQQKPIKDRVNDAYIAVAAVADEIAQGVKSGIYTKDEARGYVATLTKAKVDLDSASAFIAQGDLSSAESQMRMVDNAMQGTRSWLAQKARESKK